MKENPQPLCRPVDSAVRLARGRDVAKQRPGRREAASCSLRPLPVYCVSVCRLKTSVGCVESWPFSVAEADSFPAESCSAEHARGIAAACVSG